MPEKIEIFFRKLKNPDFLAMRYLLEVFKRMDKEHDKISKKIFDNIDVLSNYNIVLGDSANNDNYVWTADDLSECRMMISSKSGDNIVCHEFGHLLLDLFANGEVPEEFDIVNEVCVERLNSKKEFISKELRRGSDEVFKIIQDNAFELVDFLERHPEAEQEYLEKNPNATMDDCAEEFLLSFFSLMTNFDYKVVGYNKMSNIIDSMYQGNNPFFDDYGNDELFPLLSMHESEYFIEDEISPRKTSFEEQFADYLVLRLYTKELGSTISQLQTLIGEEWFEMMDRHYETVADRIGERGKVFQKKNDAE